MYNKYNYLKANDKKVLHKVKKQWITISLALLMAIGSGALATHVSASASSNQQNTTVTSAVSKPANTPAQHNLLVNNPAPMQITNPNDKIAQENPTFVSNQFNQNFHYNNPMGKSNDLDSIYPHYNSNGKIDYWNGYYLWSPVSNEAFNQLYHYKTTNFSQIKPADPLHPLSTNNVAIPDKAISVDGQTNVEVQNNNKDPIPWTFVASGSMIKNNSKFNNQSWLSHDAWGNPINPDAMLAYFATFSNSTSVNGTYLAYSNDGKQYHPYSENDVFDATTVGLPNGSDFRDPYMTTVHNGHTMIAYVAGGFNRKIYIITSNDGVHWQHQNNLDISTNNIPLSSQFGNVLVETPYVTMLNNTPIMFYGIQNGNAKQNEAVGYVTGQFNNDGIFQLDGNSKSGTVDQGFDNYAGNFTPIDADHLAYNGWYGNWTYFTFPHVGGFTLPHILSWNGNDIDATPYEPGAKENVVTKQLNTNSSLQYASDGKVILEFPKPINSFDIHLNRAGNSNLEVSFNNGVISLNRVNGTSSMDMSKSVQLPTNQLSNVQFYLDNTSVDMYLPEVQRMYSILNYDGISNAPYNISSNVPAQAISYNFDLSHYPTLDNIYNINSKFNAEKSRLNNDWNVIKEHSTESANNSKALLDNYFNIIQNAINDANSNIVQVNNYNGDGRQNTFVNLANSDMDVANTKLYQASLQLKKLDDVAMPYLGASAADARIANYYKNSISNSVASANQSKANSAASSADVSIESSIANSYAKSANSSIASSYSNSVDKSVSSANQSKANSAASSADASIESSIANSYAKSADQSIAKSEAAKSVNHQIPTPAPAPQPNVPTMPTNNIIPTVPTNPISNEHSMASSSANVANSNASEINSSASSASNINYSMNYHKSKITIPLVGLAKHSHFYSNKNKRFVLTNRMKKHVNVLQATINPNHKVTYKVRIGKRIGYLYGYLRKLFKPTFMNKLYSYVHVGKHTIKLPAKRFNRIKINRTVRYAGKNYVKYYVSYRHKHGVIYGTLPKVAKVNPSKNVYKKYYQVIPKRYHYVKVIKSLVVYDNKRFTRRTHRGSIRKGVTVRVKRLVKNGGITRFKLMNGRYITGLKKYVKLIK